MWNVNWKRTTRYYEQLARGWDRWVTVAIVLLLLVPVPFARFETWPDGRLLLQQPLLPWSHFRLCYVSFPDGVAVDEMYRFHGHWPRPEVPLDFTRPVGIPSLDPPLVQWQGRPPLPLNDLFRSGALLRLRTCWQPILLWPFRMLAASWHDIRQRSHGAGASLRVSSNR